jgi:hypothetical protein
MERMLPPMASGLAHLLNTRTAFRFHREAVAMARVADVRWQTLLVGAVSYELVVGGLGCSTAALASPTGPILARNMDWSPADLLAEASHLVRGHRNGQVEWVQAGWPGSLGVVTGMSDRGFAVALNAVFCPHGLNWRGYPVLLQLRRTLEEADGFDAAVEQLSTIRLAAGCILTLVGTENHQRVILERAPTSCAMRRPTANEPLVATNHYRVLFPERTPNPEWELDESSCPRYHALRQACQPRDGREITDDKLLYLLSDPAILQGITAQHVIFRPATQRACLCVPRTIPSALQY